jgi:UDP-3-O-acyl-N-acetylglucosamine deacetylase
MEYSWQAGKQSIEEIASARTFASEAENKILGLSGWVLGYTESSFTLPLRHPLEPAQHKALDLIGDMYLAGINPLDIGMQVISNQGGHSLNIELARALRQEILGL